jgi:hypothetical protein
MSNVTITDKDYRDIKIKLHELKKKFDSNIKITRDHYFGDIITINKGCISSNSSISALRCNCCKNVIDFAEDFNKKFDFLLSRNPPLDFMKLDNPNNSRRFKVEIKPGFFNSCGVMTGTNNQQGGFLENQLNTSDNNPNPCNITDAYPDIVKTFYKILGIPCPAFVTGSTDSVVSMFEEQDDNYNAYTTSYTGGLRIMCKTRRKSKSKKYKKMRKNKRSKKHHRHTKRRTRRK